MSDTQQTAPVPPASKPTAIWTNHDVTQLLEIVKENKAEGGDGLNFSDGAWNKMAASVNAVRTLRGILQLVEKLLTASRFSWSVQDGGNITPATQAVWDAFCKANPGASTFKAKGWIHYNAMRELLPSTPKGEHVHHPRGWKRKGKSNVVAPPQPDIVPHPELEIPADVSLSQSLNGEELVATQPVTQETEEVTDLTASQEPATPPHADLSGTPGRSAIIWSRSRHGPEPYEPKPQIQLTGGSGSHKGYDVDP
ncbi:hypothetical protein C8Q76DRAFT_692056 [Earliella scabrosa]|nr:hypothetical protein C8Q76DRAFT_692056 [Earliella scabrosa]